MNEEKVNAEVAFLAEAATKTEEVRCRDARRYGKVQIAGSGIGRSN